MTRLNAKDLAAKLRSMARQERKQGAGSDAEVLEAAAAELERLLETVLFTHRMGNERARA
jgi:hypothetical protein